jgi:ABC-type transport system involved in multi-copper enzyme maturation permease subunit
MLEIFRFECRHQLRSPLFAVIAGLWFLIAFLVTGTESVRVGGVGTNLNLNANFAILQIQYTLSILGMLPAVALVAGAITRDYEAATAEIFFATGVPERSYLFGRFAGGALFSVLIGVAGLLGTMVGTFMPWLDQERLGAFTLAPYVYSLWAIIVPNLFVISALFFSVAALTRSMMSAYVAALGFIVAYIVIGNVTDQETIGLVALGDPFGIVAFGELTRYWTVFDRNFGMPQITDTLLYNRAIWLGISAVALGFTAWRYRFNLAPPRRLRLWRKRRQRHGRSAPSVRIEYLARTPDAGPAVNVGRFLSQLWMDVRGITRSIPFYVLLAFGMLQVVGSFIGATTQLYGTPVYPLTATLINVVGGSFSIAVFIIIIYYSGELVHRERQARLTGIIDATPYPNAIMALSKVGALWFVMAALLLIVMLTSMVVQMANDYYRFEVALYLKGLFGVLGAYYFLLCVPAVLIQVLSPNKFVGMVIFLVFFLGMQTLPSLDLEHWLYRFGTPPAPYSDMNGYGHFVARFASFVVYWSAFSGLLIVLAHLFFRRGHPAGAGEVLAQVRERLSAPAMGWSAAFLVLFAASGAWIYYNTNVLNDYRTQDDRDEWAAEYEKAYKQFERLPTPQVVDIDVAVDIFPEERRLESRGTARLINRHTEPLSELHFTVSTLLTDNGIAVDGAVLESVDEDQGYYRYRFATPLASGAATVLSWDLSWINEGFPNSGGTTRVVENGSFVNNTEIMPLPGYNKGRELGDNNTRREYGLPPVERLPKMGDPEYLDESQFGVSERSAFRAVVSTAADQIAVAPGYLQDEWTEGGRRFFVYEMDAPIWPFMSFSSARYAVHEDEWNGVKLQVFHHPEHDYNIESMIEGSKQSLDYFTEAFSPYQYRQFRILEFPRYQIFAQSFPNTIPFSEAIGFVADLRDDRRIDYVFYVTAHEMAHQWWGHQVVGANMQGMTVMVETLAQYSALMVMEKAFGEERMRRFLKYELDQYLQGRGGELIEELPLMLVENQPYIHYRKGSLAMYALKDAIGEDRVNQALRSFVDRWGFVDGVFPTARDLVAEFRDVAGPEHQALITDLFEKIVIFDLRVTDATVEETGDGFSVTMTVDAKKFEANGAGEETEVPLAQELDIAVFAEDSEDLGDDDLPAPLVFERRVVESGEQTFTFLVEKRPGRVGIDPYVKMIDRNPDDNVRAI